MTIEAQLEILRNLYSQLLTDTLPILISEIYEIRREIKQLAIATSLNVVNNTIPETKVHKNITIDDKDPPTTKIDKSENKKAAKSKPIETVETPEPAEPQQIKKRKRRTKAEMLRDKQLAICANPMSAEKEEDKKGTTWTAPALK